MIAGASWTWWIGFHIAVILLLVIDGNLPSHRRKGAESPSAAWLWTGVLVLAAAVFAAWIREGQAAGEIPSVFTPAVLAKHLFNTYSGLKVFGKAKPERKALEDIVKVALSVLEGPGAPGPR